MDRSRSTQGTKPKPTCGTDLGTKTEQEARTAEGVMEKDGGKGTRSAEANIMGHGCSCGQTQGQVEATHFWPYLPLGGRKLS